MPKQNPGPVHYTLLFLAILFLSGCFKSLTHTNVILAADFENAKLYPLEVSGWDNGSFGPVKDTRISFFNGTKVLGKLNSNLIQLNLTGLPDHQVLRVEFDLYIHDKWKNDLWKFTIDGADQLLTGFSNDSTVKQSYPNWLGNSSPLSPAGRSAINTDLPGGCSPINSAHGSSLYRIISTIPHNAQTVTISCSDAGNFFNDTCQRSWSIDNLKVSAFKN